MQQRLGDMLMTTYLPHSRFPNNDALTRCVLMAVATASYCSASGTINRSAISDHIARRSGIPVADTEACIGEVHRAGLVTLSTDGARVGLGEAGRAWLRSRAAH